MPEMGAEIEIIINRLPECLLDLANRRPLKGDYIVQVEYPLLSENDVLDYTTLLSVFFCGCGL